MKTIILHVKDDNQMELFRQFETSQYGDEKKYSHEIKSMINEFKSNGWNVLLASIDNFNFETNTWDKIYSVNDNAYLSLNMDEANSYIDTIIVRVIGSVEGNFDIIQKYLNVLKDNFKGQVLNNPKAMLKGMTKNYLTEIDEYELKDIGMKIIPTKIYANDVSLDEITYGYDNLDDYLIKPVSGELSNSLSNLGKIDEEFLRRKESKVKGWVVQPIQKEIYNGEYQISFLNKKKLYAQMKDYQKIVDNIPVQKARKLEEYKDIKELATINRVIDYFEHLYDLDLDICRVDYMKDENGTPILLEFEMVNPGFFIGYMEDDKKINEITGKIRTYCENNRRH